MDFLYYRYEKIDSLLQSKNDLYTFLYFTTEASDYPGQYGVDNLVELLEKNTLKNLTEETHATTSFKTIQNGIADYFIYYPVLRFNSIEEFISNGERAHLDSYYLQRKLN